MAQETMYVVLTAPGPDQKFVELENARGKSIGSVPLNPYPGEEGLWRLGPFTAEVTSDPAILPIRYNDKPGGSLELSDQIIRLIELGAPVSFEPVFQVGSDGAKKLIEITVVAHRANE